MNVLYNAITDSNASLCPFLDFSLAKLMLSFTLKAKLVSENLITAFHEFTDRFSRGYSSVTFFSLFIRNENALEFVFVKQNSANAFCQKKSLWI